MTTANKITITRILLIPVFVLMALYYARDREDWQRFTAIAIFTLAAASDGLDGYIARRYNQRSQLGMVLDPIADKGLLLAGIITLSLSHWKFGFPIWFPVLVIARDVIVVAGAVALQFLNGQVRIKPSWVGKTATVMQMIALGVVMLEMNLFSREVALGSWQTRLDFVDLPIYFAGLFTAISGGGYILEGIRQLQAGGHGDPKSTEQLHL